MPLTEAAKLYFGRNVLVKDLSRADQVMLEELEPWILDEAFPTESEAQMIREAHQKIERRLSRKPRR